MGHRSRNLDAAQPSRERRAPASPPGAISAQRFSNKRDRQPASPFSSSLLWMILLSSTIKMCSFQVTSKVLTSQRVFSLCVLVSRAWTLKGPARPTDHTLCVPAQTRQPVRGAARRTVCLEPQVNIQSVCVHACTYRAGCKEAHPAL